MCPALFINSNQLQRLFFGVDEIEVMRIYRLDAQIGANLKYAARDKNNGRHLSAK